MAINPQSITDFKQNYNPAPTNRFHAYVTRGKILDKNLDRTMTLRCESADLPGRGFATSNQQLYGPIRRIPYNSTYIDATLVFQLSDNFLEEKRYFDQWQDAMQNPNSFDVAYYEAAGQVGASGLTRTVFIYGSEFKKGTVGMTGSLEADDVIFDNSPIIIKDKYAVNGSDMAQIGWIEITTENGASGYLWYMKSEHETRLRFDDYLETAMIEAVPAEAASGAIAATGDVGNKGSKGIFFEVENRGNVWAGGNPSTLADFDSVISRLDKQGSIEENVIFVDREFSFDIDDMLAAQNSYGAGGTSYGLFDNDKDMALNLGFTGFRRGYDFYKSDWKYLNDPTMRGGLPTGANSGRINGLLVPAGSTTVYDQILGKNAKRPFLHVRFRASETEDRRYKTWITGSAGGAMTSSLDAMEVHFLSERAVCTLGANNFFIFQE